jgi:hypothetical protein
VFVSLFIGGFVNRRFAARGVAGILSIAVSAALLQLAPTAVADPGPVDAGDQVVEAAQAYEAGVPSTAAALVDAASPVGSVDLNKTGSGFVAQGPDGSGVEIDKSGEVTLSAPGVPDIGVSVAGAEGRSVMADGVAVRSEALPSTDVVTRATDDGVQLVAVLNDENAPDSISFQVDLPKGGRLMAQPDGGVLVQAPVKEASSGSEVGFQDIAAIAPAWAVDAKGNQVGTQYEIHGNQIIQVINPDSTMSFPVVADPTMYSCDLKLSTCVKLSKAETKAVWMQYASVGVVAAVGYLCTKIPYIPVAAVCIGALATYGAAMKGTFKAAAAEKKCVELHFARGSILPWKWKKVGC